MNIKFDFNEFRKWFNQMFSLSFNGKFKGLSTLRDLYGMSFIEHLHYKLYKMMYRVCRYTRFNNEVILLRLGGNTIKLYNR